MWDNVVGRMIARAMPPGIIDPNQEIIAAEAAKNGIRQAAWILGVAGVVVLSGITAMLYSYFRSPEINQGPSEAAIAASQLGADNVKLRMANKDLQGKLEDVTEERDSLRGMLTDLTGQVADLSRRRQPARPSAANGQEQAEQPKEIARPSEPAPEEPAAETQVDPASPPSTYECGDGRAVSDMAACKEAENPPAPQVAASSATVVAPEPPPAQQTRPAVAPAAVPTHQLRRAVPQPIAPDPPSGR